MTDDLVQDMIKDTIQDLNDGNVRDVKASVSKIIRDIVSQQRIVAEAQEKIAASQAALRCIENPTQVNAVEILGKE